MSYLSPQAGEIVTDNHRQPTDMNRKDWFSTLGVLTPTLPEQSTQGAAWLGRRPPGLRFAAKV